MSIGNRFLPAEIQHCYFALFRAVVVDTQLAMASFFYLTCMNMHVKLIRTDNWIHGN